MLDQPLIDSGVASLVALYLLHGAWQVGRSSFDVLMDRELPAADRQRVIDIVRAHPAVRDWHDLRTRSSGLTRFIQLHIGVDRDLSLLAGHQIGAEVQARIREAFPDAEIILHVDPLEAAP